MNYKRRKPRRKVRCSMCTDARGGNGSKAIGRRSREAGKFKPTAQENAASWGA